MVGGKGLWRDGGNPANDSQWRCASGQSASPGSHGTLYAGDRKTTVKDRKKEIGKGLLGKMLVDLGIDWDDF